MNPFYTFQAEFSRLMHRKGVSALLVAAVFGGIILSGGLLQYAFAQSTTDVLINPLGGNVGIGTTTPDYTLDVEGTIGVEWEGIESSRIGIFNNSGATVSGNFYIEADKNDTGNYWETKFVSEGPHLAHWRSYFSFYTKNGIESLSEKVRIEADGSVGIGTTTPREKLEVNGALLVAPGSAASPSVRFQPAVADGFYSTGPGGIGATAGDIPAFNFDNSFLRAEGGTGNVQLRFANASEAQPAYAFIGDPESGLYQPELSELGFSTAETERVRIDSAGNVGIGTTDPQWKLDVRGSVGFQFASNRWFNFVNAGSSSDIVYPNSDGVQFGQCINDDYPCSGWTPRMILHPDGDLEVRQNVGIGTNDPQSTLQVNGYVQLDLTTGAPPAADCDAATERGRMKVDNAAGTLYVCVDSGWVAK